MHLPDCSKCLAFLPNLGNVGDSLITWGTEVFFEREGKELIQFTHCRELEQMVSYHGIDTIVIAGGGHSVVYYRHMRKALESLLSVSRPFNDLHKVCLPLTVDATFAELYSSLCTTPGGCTIYLRDRRSYDVLAESIDRKHLRLSKDMALHLDADAVGLTYADPAEDRTLFVRRRDLESVAVDWGIKPARCDTIVDLTGASGSCDLHVGKETALAVLRTMANHTRIVTDRLHAAIGAVIIGHPDVSLCRNSYFKNRAVWEYSLESLGVKWHVT